MATAITAARLGSSPLMIDWTGLMSAPIGSTPYGRHTQSDPVRVAEAWGRLKARFESGEIGFYDAPINTEISQIQEVEALTRSLLTGRAFTDCLFLGIGGSSLGPLCVLQALKERAKNPIQFHFQENPDPLDWKATLSRLRPESTLVVAVTKSGTTFETMAQLLLALEWLGSERIKSHLVCVTDPKSGDLRKWATTHQVQTLSIHPSVGGRFSVFTPVGLFAMALSGLNCADFLKGAEQVRSYLQSATFEKNAVFGLSYELLQHASQRSVHVCMPYSTRLRTVGQWWVQLWGESLGKDGKGFTPVAAVGATDQHSILQLLRDGPDDKVTWFISVDRVSDPVPLPSSPIGIGKPDLPAFTILAHNSLQSLLEKELRATSLVLSRRQRPHLTLRLEQLDERNLGALLYMLCVTTAMTGALLGVNPFDQPGVEEGKGYIREYLMEDRKTHQDQTDGHSAVSRLRRDSEGF